MNCVIIDDDKEFSEKLEKCVRSFLKNIFSVFTIQIFNDDFYKILKGKIDLMFVDIDLNGQNGISIIKYLRTQEKNTIIIYVSRRQELVFASLVTKPFYFVRKQNFENDLDEVFKLLKEYYKNTMKSVTFEYYGRKTSIFLKDIHYIISYGHDISIVTDDNTYTYRSNLKDVLKMIGSHFVVQVQRSYIVSLMYVKEVEGMTITLNDNTKITMGKKYYKDFLIKYKEFLLL